MYIDLEGARELLKKACDIRNEGIDYSMEASVAKVFSAKTVNNICYQAIQIIGGSGYIRDIKEERYYRDGRLIDIGVGTSEVIGMVIGANPTKAIFLMIYSALHRYNPILFLVSLRICLG